MSGAGGSRVSSGSEHGGAATTTRGGASNATEGGSSADAGDAAFGGQNVGARASGGSPEGTGGNADALRGGTQHTGGFDGAGVSNGGAAGAGAVGAGAAGLAGHTGNGAAGACSGDATSSYDQLVLCDHPVGYWTLGQTAGSEPDLSGNGHAGTYKGGNAAKAELPNGEQATAFDGATQFLTIPSQPSFSITTSGELTWEAWIRPDVLQFKHDSGGYVDWLGKCHEYAPTCEWEARLYDTDNDQGRCNRFSAYVFNPSAGLGSGADFQPDCGLIQTGQWYHVVGEYTLKTQPSDCEDAAQYPGAIEIWVNGVKWDHSHHGQTGCFSQYQVVPKANQSPINVGTMAEDAWFQGAVGKLAIYDYALPGSRIGSHYRQMTGREPTGSCGNTCTF